MTTLAERTIGAMLMAAALSVLALCGLPALAQAQTCYPPPCTSPTPSADTERHTGQPRDSATVDVRTGFTADGDSVIVGRDLEGVRRRGVLSGTGSSLVVPLVSIGAGLTVVGLTFLLLTRRHGRRMPASPATG